MKILQLISSGGFYGAESVLVNLSVELERLGHSCLIGVFENSANKHTEVADRAEAMGLSVRHIPCHGQMDWQTVREIRRIILDQQIALVHAHGYKADFYALLGRRGTPATLAATCHNWLGNKLTMRSYARLDRYLLRRFDGIAAVSKAVAEKLQQSGVRRRVEVIPNGVKTHRDVSDDRADLFRRGGRLVVGTVGRLSAEKGAAVLIEAAAKVVDRFHEVLFVAVGDGPLRLELEARVRQLGIAEQFFFAGARKDIAEVYRSFDVFVLPSLTEGMPMALLEAMAAGLPVVATNVGAVSEVIRDASVGTVVEPGDAAALGAAICDFLGDREKRESSGVQGKKRVEEHFSAAAMARAYLDFYQNALRHQRLKSRVPGISSRPAKTEIGSGAGD